MCVCVCVCVWRGGAALSSKGSFHARPIHPLSIFYPHDINKVIDASFYICQNTGLDVERSHNTIRLSRRTRQELVYDARFPLSALLGSRNN